MSLTAALLVVCTDPVTPAAAPAAVNRKQRAKAGQILNSPPPRQIPSRSRRLAKSANDASGSTSSVNSCRPVAKVDLGALARRRWISRRRPNPCICRRLASLDHLLHRRQVPLIQLRPRQHPSRHLVRQSRLETISRLLISPKFILMHLCFRRHSITAATISPQQAPIFKSPCACCCALERRRWRICRT